MAPPSKKRKLKESKTAEVVFDPSARFDYLTGFHKRKVERTKKARETAALKARQEKIEDRKRLREERKADLEAHVKAVNALLPVQRPTAESDDGSQNGDVEDSWEGIPDAEPEPIDHEEEYIDEDKYTTVVVEEVDISRDGITRLKHAEGDGEKAEVVPESLGNGSEKQKKPASTRTRDKDKRPKKKKKSFRYESPAERKMNRAKVAAKNSKAAKIRRGE